MKTPTSSHDSSSRCVLKACRKAGSVGLTMTILLVVSVHLSLAGLAAQGSMATRQGSVKQALQKAARQDRTRSRISRHFDLDDPTQAWREGEALRLDEVASQPAASNAAKKRRRSTNVSLMVLLSIVVTNTDDSGAGSLRDAINTANTNGVADQIVFSIPTSDAGFDGSTFTIKPITALPALTEGGTLIDGTSQTASTGDTNPAGPEVVVNGSLVPGGPPGSPPAGPGGVRILSPDNTISGLVINGFPNQGIDIRGPNSDHNAVTGCYIGTDATGSAAVGNAAQGIWIRNGADSNQIGGTTPGSGNVISGNGVSAGSGINIWGATGAEGSNTIQGNLIGTNAAGTAALPNGGNGININGSSNNLVGGIAPGAGNVCSGNVLNGYIPGGVRIGGLPFTSPTTVTVIGSSGNIVQGNLCGTNAAGTGAIPSGAGVRLSFGATNNIVGGSTPAAGNVCSGNMFGVLIEDSQPVFQDAFGNPILVPFIPVSGNTIQGNFIGTDVTGALPIGNKASGVSIFSGATDNLIGGAGPGQGNVIAFNTGGFFDDGNGGMIFVAGDGVHVEFDPNNPDDPNPTVRNRVSGNSIHSNNGLGIDLSPADIFPFAGDGPTSNDPCDVDAGPNDFQNFPVLTSVQTSGGITIIQGTLNSTANTAFNVEFFSNDDCDPSGFGEGQTFIGSATVTTDGACNASFTVSLPGTIGSKAVTATATDPNGNTSEFSNCKKPPQLTALSPAKVWLGLKNSDDVGTKFDLLAEVFRNGSPIPIASKQLDGVPGGSSGFNNAVLRTITLALSAPVDVCSGDTLSIRLSVRIAVGVSGHRSGTARLWFNDAAANSRFGATVGGVTSDYFLLNGFTLGAAAGPGPKKTIDVFVDRAVGGNPFKPFGTWSKMF